MYNIQGLIVSETAETYLDVAKWAPGRYLVEVQNYEGDILHSTFIKK